MVIAVKRGGMSIYDISSIQGQSVCFFALYLAFTSLSIWAIVELASQNPDARPVVAGWLTPLSTSFLYILVLVVSYTVIPNFVAFPVGPRWLFASLDLLVAMCFGLCIAGIASIVVLMIANALLVLPFAFSCYKYMTVLLDVRAGRRSEFSGARISL